MEEEIAKIIFRTFKDNKALVHFSDAKSLVARTIYGLDVATMAETVQRLAREQEPPAFLS